MKTNQLAAKVAHGLSQKITSRSLAAGAHISAQNVADEFGVSRSPVREALEMLEKAGLVEKRTNRGYFVSETEPEPASADILKAMAPDDSSVYLRIAEDWRTDRLPEEVTEQYLREKYDLSRGRLQDILVRAVREGWVERKPGYGWRFLDVAKTPEAFDKIYHFRMVIEPAAMLDPDYSVDWKILASLKDEQQRLLDHEIENNSVEHLLSVGARFHEELIKFSGNPHFHMALVRVNQMRRLLEYKAVVSRDRFVEQTNGHLEIIGHLERAEIAEASYAMRHHLGGALKGKSELLRTKS
ncbi:GntR family transcriptional regulator [uncultured Roseibium sp.]|uniref:GntR family transcriptional regulator n=1 Tax=uncultured Roseibium sp. TaxID=1936171 RepID=UPI002634DC88|nr:GntR family transcriptional regulator [uncultured Roseibium sp.]